MRHIRFLLFEFNHVLVCNSAVLERRKWSFFTFPFRTHMPTKKYKKERQKNYVFLVKSKDQVNVKSAWWWSNLLFWALKILTLNTNSLKKIPCIWGWPPSRWIHPWLRGRKVVPIMSQTFDLILLSSLQFV